MKFYLDPQTDEVYAYDNDQVVAGVVADGLVEMTETEIQEHLHPPPPALDQVEADSLRRIDVKASEVRDRFITSGVGQSAIYMRKLEEARAYQNAENPVDTDYPRLKAEGDRCGMTVAEKAAEIVQRNAAWVPPEIASEAERCGGKRDVRLASTAAAKRAAADAAIAILDGITPE